MDVFWDGPFFRAASFDHVNRALSRSLAARNINVVVHSWDAVPNPVPEDWKWFLAHRAGFKTVDAHVRHGWPPTFSSRMGPFFLLQHWEAGAVPKSWINPIRRYVRRVLVVSEAVRDMFVAGGIPGEMISVIPLGINPDHFYAGGPRCERWDRYATRFLFVGGLISRKGIDILLSAYQKAFDADNSVILIIKAVGSQFAYDDASILDALEAFRSDPKNPAIDWITDNLTEEAMASLYRSASVLVHPYRGEGFGLPLLEAMACGIPIIVSDFGPAREFVPRENALWISGNVRYFTPESYESQGPGWYFEPNEDHLVTLLRQATENLPVVHSVAEWRQAWSWDHAAEELEAILKSEVMPREGTRRVYPERAVLLRAPGRSPSGYGQATRLWLKAFQHHDVAVRLLDIDDPVVYAGHEGIDVAAWEDVVVRSGTPAVQFAPGFALQSDYRGPNIVYTMWETDEWPQTWKLQLDQADHVIVPSTWDYEKALRIGVASEHLSVVPLPLDTDRFHPDGPKLWPMDHRFRFLSVFDWQTRKGWDILLRAWAQAFRSTDPVVLILKVTKIATASQAQQEQWRALRKDLSNTAPVVLLDSVVSATEMAALYRSVHAFVLPTRGEGWGLPILEAMASGLPVIATDWSGSSVFMNRKNSLPLAIDGLEPVPDSEPFSLFRGQQWAKPSLEDLIEKLRWVFGHYQSLDALRNEARRTAEDYHPDRVASALLSVLEPFWA
ncbi:glycosyltransferase [Sulfobacillus thermosulfidooxidans]|uniref:glycosyltransferase n=1 Tax=Sulfobacillus thermosulfidooxidans TaxID=28034 RepID=UPI0006B5C49E|nr:glycosyltransferase [Sulfobacillus thermosulfidooxidans]